MRDPWKAINEDGIPAVFFLFKKKDGIPHDPGIVERRRESKFIPISELRSSLGMRSLSVSGWIELWMVIECTA